MGNARNSSKNVSAAAKLSTNANQQHHGVPHTPQPWHAKQAAAQAAKHSRDLNRVQEMADRGNSK